MKVTFFKAHKICPMCEEEAPVGIMVAQTEEGDIEEINLAFGDEVKEMEDMYRQMQEASEEERGS